MQTERQEVPFEFFTLKVMEQWNRLPSEVVESLSLKVYKPAPGHNRMQPGLGKPALAGLGPDELQRSLQPQSGLEVFQGTGEPVPDPT